jgi:hypothetical protein
MKKMIVIPALILMISVSAFAKNAPAPVKVVSKMKDVVYFKASCEMIGASINVTDAEGNVIYTGKVTDHKVIVDFYAEPSGTYIIHVQKNDKDESITYNKSTVSHSELADHNEIIVTQM